MPSPAAYWVPNSRVLSGLERSREAVSPASRVSANAGRWERETPEKLPIPQSRKFRTPSAVAKKFISDTADEDR